VPLQYVPYVGDSKRAMDEYTSEIFMGGKNTIVLHNTCEDSLLAAPIILDLVLLAELSTRIQFKSEAEVKNSFPSLCCKRTHSLFWDYSPEIVINEFLFLSQTFWHLKWEFFDSFSITIFVSNDLKLCNLLNGYGPKAVYLIL